MADAKVSDRRGISVPAETAGDRRQASERRTTYDRRGDPWTRTPSPEARPYGFRTFTDRRCGLDRRMYGTWSVTCGDEELAPDEIRALFHDSGDGDR